MNTEVPIHDLDRASSETLDSSHPDLEEGLVFSTGVLTP
jgi:hypothetical protein